MGNYHTSEKPQTALWWSWQDLNLKQGFSIYATSIKKHHSNCTGVVNYTTDNLQVVTLWANFYS